MASIRIALAADQRRLSAFARRTFEETFGPQNTAENMRAYLDDAFSDARLAAELADPRRITLLAEEASAIVGYAQLCRSDAPACVAEPESIELVRLYVDRTRQGKGTAQQLMQAVEEAAQSQVRAIWLGVWEENPRAIAFYAKCGFDRVGEHQFKLGDDLQTDHIMVKPLCPDAAAV